jgi:hypothetical protein
MDIKFIYDKVKMWVEEFYGKSRWCYTDYFLDDDGYRCFAEQIKTDKDITTETKYVVALFAHNIKEAHQAIGQYMKQGFEDMELVAIKETKYLGVLK